MKDSDRILLDGLRATVCADVSQDHWDLVVKATEDAGDIRLIDGYAGTVLRDAIEKAKKKRNKIQTVMHEFKTGKLHSSSGEEVTDPKQAIAIALSEQRRAKKKVKKAESADSSLVAMALGKMLADTVSVYHQAHGYHWNVKGQDFAQYHQLFGEIYGSLYESIDGIAENILKMGQDAPFRMSELMQMRSIPEAMPADTPMAMATELLRAIDALIEVDKRTFDVANSVNEQGVANFIAELIDENQKWSWQLRSSIGLEKASFNSRSEAGRYAAEQRWKDHVKREPSGGQPKYSRAGDIPEGLRRVLFRWMDPDGPQTSADALRALVSGGVLTPDMLNNYDRELLGYPPLQGKRQPLPKGYIDVEEETDSKPFLDLTDVDPQGKMEAGAKPAKAPKESASPETVKRIKEGDLSEIADVIRRDLRAQGKKVPFGAQPYLDAMSSLGSITEKYGEDSGSSIVAYLLSNLTSYKGATAREVKAELNRRFKEEMRKA